MSRRRQVLPLSWYSLSPERYSRRRDRNSFARCEVQRERTRPPVTFRFDRTFDGLDRPDLCGLNCFDLEVFAVKAVGFANCVVGNRFDDLRLLYRLRLQRVYVDCVVIECAQRLVDVLELVLVDIERLAITDEMQHDLGHTAWFAIPGTLEDDVLHLAAAERFGALFAEHPRDGIGDVRLAAAVRTDDRSDAVAGENDLGIVRKRFKTCNF